MNLVNLEVKLHEKHEHSLIKVEEILKIKLLLSFLSKVHVANIRVNQESIEALKEIDEVTNLSIYLKFNV